MTLPDLLEMSMSEVSDWLEENAHNYTLVSNETIQELHDLTEE